MTDLISNIFDNEAAGPVVVSAIGLGLVAMAFARRARAGSPVAVT